MTWTCSRCNRVFRQVNQRHACGLGSRSTLLKNRPRSLVQLFGRLEAIVSGLGGVEVVVRDRCALFRTTRIFADLAVTRDALRVVIHLDREVRAPYFIKVARGDKRVSHVTLIRTIAELRRIAPLMREAYELATSEEPRAAVQVARAADSRGLRKCQCRLADR